MKITKDTPLKTILALSPACSCDKCRHGCTMGSGIFVDDQVEELASSLQIPIETLKHEMLEELQMYNKMVTRPKILREDLPFGRCIFYDEVRGCAIHKHKPMQCKVSMGCKGYGEDLFAWFLLKYLVDPDDPESLRQYAIYLACGGKLLPQGNLHDLVK